MEVKKENAPTILQIGAVSFRRRLHYSASLGQTPPWTGRYPVLVVQDKGRVGRTAQANGPGLTPAPCFYGPVSAKPPYLELVGAYQTGANAQLSASIASMTVCWHAFAVLGLNSVLTNVSRAWSSG